MRDRLQAQLSKDVCRQMQAQVRQADAQWSPRTALGCFLESEWLGSDLAPCIP